MCSEILQILCSIWLVGSGSHLSYLSFKKRGEINLSGDLNHRLVKVPTEFLTKWKQLASFTLLVYVRVQEEHVNIRCTFIHLH